MRIWKLAAIVLFILSMSLMLVATEPTRTVQGRGLLPGTIVRAQTGTGMMVTTYSIRVGGTGRFSLNLPTGHTYVFSIIRGGRFLGMLKFPMNEGDADNWTLLPIYSTGSPIDMSRIRKIGGIYKPQNNPLSFVDTDEDGMMDCYDMDDDNDGEMDMTDMDCDGNGVPDMEEDMDCDGDGICDDMDDDTSSCQGGDGGGGSGGCH